MKNAPFLVTAVLASLLVLTGCTHQAANPTQKAITSSTATPKTNAHDLIDINSASKAELEALPGIGEAYAQKIIDHRPYREKSDLVRLKLIPDSTYQTISDKIIAHQKQ